MESLYINFLFICFCKSMAIGLWGPIHVSIHLRGTQPLYGGANSAERFFVALWVAFPIRVELMNIQ